jgi:hypothetical protein
MKKMGGMRMLGSRSEGGLTGTAPAGIALRDVGLGGRDRFRGAGRAVIVPSVAYSGKGRFGRRVSVAGLLPDGVSGIMARGRGGR